jgi:predicted acylesterase/phospholipase RssA
MTPPTPRPYCDLIMKGGVTSGIVYPKMISRLARDFQFKNIGGTSAGAIAAAACAAAELGRQSGRNPGAFDALDTLPEELGKSGPHGSRLMALFQPAPALRAPFRLAMAFLGHRSPARTLWQLLAQVTHFTPWLALTLFAWVAMAWMLGGHGLAWSLQTAGMCAGAMAMAGAAVAWTGRRAGSTPGGVAGASGFAMALALALSVFARASSQPLLLFGLFLALAGTLLAVFVAGGLWRFGRGFLDGLHDNFYGICPGLGTDEHGNAALTDWLAPYLNRLAGLDAARPLTFRDLWGAGGEHDRAINLEVVTTALSQHASYGIPFRPGSGAFYFQPGEWRRLFPASVVDWLASQPNAGHGAPPDSGLVRLPVNGDLPVIVAVRMSLSFPLLLSAVPLYAHDFTEKSADGHATMKRIWFSDGGISSNLPLHFFDQLLPAHPTFAINLKAFHPSHPIDDSQPCGDTGRAYLPTNNHDGAGRYWEPPANGAVPGLLGFLRSIVATALRWRDESLFPYPGYRDRIVQVSLRDSEGGLHLAMSPDQITAMAAAGSCAGELLYRRFHPDGGDDGWPNHQRVRLQSVLGTLEGLARAAVTARMDAPVHAPWDAAIDALEQQRYTHAQAALARHLLHELENMGAAVLDSGADLAAAMYKPHPVLKLTPRA